MAAYEHSILIVEDYADTRLSLAEILVERGYRVDCATNGREALEYLRNAPAPSLILLDLMTPVMDGWEFRRNQQEDPALASIPTVILSSAADEYLPPGTAGHLTKPLDIRELLTIVARICKRATE